MNHHREHQVHMQRALELAVLGTGYVAPNPLVGAVIVGGDGQVLAEGYHHRHGAEHAEINALNKVKDLDLSQATLYCNLEPCSHEYPGKINPPCAQQVIQAGFKRVVIGSLDPNPAVQGRGVQLLKEAGIDVITGVCEAESQRLNQIFSTNMLRQRPFVLLKAAQTLDGRLATRTGHSKWISNLNARTEAHALRAKYDAVLVGSGTVWHDDPKLNVRHVTGRDPWRLVLDSRLSLSLDSLVFSDELAHKTILFTAQRHSAEALKPFFDRGIQVIQLPLNGAHLDLRSVIQAAYERGITSILVEGGEHLLTRMIENRYADALYLVIAPKIIGRGVDTVGDLSLDSMDEAVTFTDIHYRIMDDQVIFEGKFAECLLDS